jgi:hypothetical protein
VLLRRVAARFCLAELQPGRHHATFVLLERSDRSKWIGTTARLRSPCGNLERQARIITSRLRAAASETHTIFGARSSARYDLPSCLAEWSPPDAIECVRLVNAAAKTSSRCYVHLCYRRPSPFTCPWGHAGGLAPRDKRRPPFATSIVRAHLYRRPIRTSNVQ